MSVSKPGWHSMKFIRRTNSNLRSGTFLKYLFLFEFSWIEVVWFFFYEKEADDFHDDKFEDRGQVRTSLITSLDDLCESSLMSHIDGWLPMKPARIERLWSFTYKSVLPWTKDCHKMETVGTRYMYLHSQSYFDKHN